MQEPRLILADEPVASLDPATSHSVLRYVEELNKKDGITVLCAIHFLSLARRYGTRILALRAGQVVYEGMPADVDEKLRIFCSLSAGMLVATVFIALGKGGVPRPKLIAEHPVEDNLKVKLAHAGDYHLAAILVGAHLEGGVFLGEADKGVIHLVLVNLCTWLDCD